VYEGRGWDNVGAHVRDHNHNSIGIAFIGNFNSRNPNNAAILAAKALIRCGVSQVNFRTCYILLSCHILRYCKTVNIITVVIK